MRVMLEVCNTFAVHFDVKFNTSNSVALVSIGKRYNDVCAPLTLTGGALGFVDF